MLGVEKLIITNACGAVNTSFKPGDLMLITDHINLTANNPLIGPNNPDLGVRFLECNLTLVGFFRGDKGVIYSWAS